MKLAIMQPYFFPYIGYFQLMNAVDLFVLYDDVSYINRGWVNRNRIAVAGSPWLFTVPLANASQNVLIKDLRLARNADEWKHRFMKTVAQSYRKAPMFSTVLAMLERTMDGPAVWLMDWIRASFEEISRHLGMQTVRKSSSVEYGNRELRGQDRILDICAREKADVYVNPINGVELYDRDAFACRNVQLRFLKPEYEYRQFGDSFIPHLSIIDALMFNSPGDMVCLLENYVLE